ncbi:hypothetical protein, partial [Brevifollis gellanilyticus]|uniref:hypothetical protein n=1 Tax=Brevifollis gellanilyticus TaxID=748831 RepID=UPI001C3F61D5
GWRLAVGGWRLAVGGWRLAVGGWRLAVEWAEVSAFRGMGEWRMEKGELKMGSGEGEGMVGLGCLTT